VARSPRRTAVLAVGPPSPHHRSTHVNGRAVPLPLPGEHTEISAPVPGRPPTPESDSPAPGATNRWRSGHGRLERNHGRDDRGSPRPGVVLLTDLVARRGHILGTTGQD